MLTDLVQIRLLGEKNRAENERFRRFLKSNSHADKKLRHIAEGIQEQIDCLQCANCCRVATTSLSDRDVERLAKHLRIPLAKFLAEYTTSSPEDPRILRQNPETGCVFLDGNACSVYDARPDICQRFPHLVRGQGSLASRAWALIDRATYCPIVYNSLEAFKDALKFQR